MRTKRRSMVTKKPRKNGAMAIWSMIAIGVTRYFSRWARGWAPSARGSSTETHRRRRNSALNTATEKTSKSRKNAP